MLCEDPLKDALEAKQRRQAIVLPSHRVETLQLLCDECVFALNQDHEEEEDQDNRVVVPIDVFLRNAKADSSQNIFDLNK